MITQDQWVDTWTTSHYNLYGKCIGATNENSNFDLTV